MQNQENSKQEKRIGCDNAIGADTSYETKALLEENERLRGQCKLLLSNSMNLQERLFEIQSELDLRNRQYDVVQEALNSISNAFLWKATKPLRVCLDRIKGVSNTIHNEEEQKQANISSEQLPCDININTPLYKPGDSVTILATKHTSFIAKLIEHSLGRLQINTTVFFDEPDVYDNGLYIVICPQIFKKLPPRYVAFQMEQTVSSRWLNTEYLSVLEHSYAILDYSLVNISNFRDTVPFGRNFYYLPVDFLPDMQCTETDYRYDVLFYGDDSSLRRRTILDELKKHFSICVLQDEFGDELYRKLSRAKVVLNLHYYENAMLETTRLYETLSVGGSIIVSERSSDPEEEKRLEGIVDFVPAGDIVTLVNRVNWWLSHEQERQDTVRRNREVLMSRSNAFDYYFFRFMLANDWISFDTFYRLASNFARLESDRVCLSLPEETERRKAFDKDNHFQFYVLPGLRHQKGWVGCGLSYKFIMKKALDQGFKKILICEDDVLFPDDFEQRFDECLQYLNEKKEWHIFQGLMSDIGKVTLRKVEHWNGQTFVYLDHMISTVFNIYDKSVFNDIIGWDENNRDVQTNTIDRSLEAKNLNIVTTFPFLAGHKEDLKSSVWGFQNSQYNDLIAASSEKLKQLVLTYEAEQQQKKR